MQKLSKGKSFINHYSDDVLLITDDDEINFTSNTFCMNNTQLFLRVVSKIDPGVVNTEMLYCIEKLLEECEDGCQ